MPARPGRALTAAVIAAWLLLGREVAAHPAPFSYLDLRISSQSLAGRLVLHDLDVAHELSLAPETMADPAVLERHGASIAQLVSGRLVLQADGDFVAWKVTSIRPLPDRTAVELEWTGTVARTPGHITIQASLFPYDPNHQTFVNVYEDTALVRQEVLNLQRPSMEVYSGTRQGLLAVFTTFTRSGIHHIAIGPDHILFIVGLLLLGGSMRRLLAIVTAFTLGHSVTLALATLNVVAPPARIIEPAIALSIVYVGADNLLVGTRGRDVRPWVALFFGLVHGFGFASVLRETGLPDKALGLSLFSFNLGVEIGQAAIVIVVSSALMLLRGRNAPLAARLATVGSVAVMLAGAFWFVERIL